MARDNILATALGSALLAVPMLLIVVNVLEYEIGIAVPWNPFDLIYESGHNTPLTFSFDGLIVLGPVVGLAALFAPLTDTSFGGQERVRLRGRGPKRGLDYTRPHCPFHALPSQLSASTWGPRTCPASSESTSSVEVLWRSPPLMSFAPSSPKQMGQRP